MTMYKLRINQSVRIVNMMTFFIILKIPNKDQNWEKILYWQYKGKIGKMLEEAKNNYDKVYSDIKSVLDDDTGVSLTDIRKILFDMLLYAKALIMNHDFIQAIKVLDECMASLKMYKINTEEIMRTLVIDRRENKLDGNDELGSLWMSNRPSDQNNPNKNQEYKVSRGGTQTFASFKVILSSYATIAALYTR